MEPGITTACGQSRKGRVKNTCSLVRPVILRRTPRLGVGALPTPDCPLRPSGDPLRRSSAPVAVGGVRAARRDRRHGPAWRRGGPCLRAPDCRRGLTPSSPTRPILRRPAQRGGILDVLATDETRRLMYGLSQSLSFWTLNGWDASRVCLLAVVVIHTTGRMLTRYPMSDRLGLPDNIE